MTPRSCHYNGVEVSTVNRDYRSIAQIERERARRENFERGCRWAAALLCGMFAFLSMGCVMFGW